MRAATVSAKALAVAFALLVPISGAETATRVYVSTLETGPSAGPHPGARTLGGYEIGDNEIGELRVMEDSGLARRLLASLDELDKARIPASGDSLVPWLNSCFTDSFELDDYGALLVNGESAASRWSLWRAEVDGVQPTDYILYLRGTGTVGDYSITVVVRSPSEVIYQRFGGELRGMRNMLGRARQLGTAQAESLLACCRLFDHVADLDSDGREDLLLHNNVVCYSEEEDQLGIGPTMSDLCDLPVPYFWSGERLLFDEARAAEYYDRVLVCLAHAAKRDSAEMSGLLRSFLISRLRRDTGGLAPN